MKNTIADPIPAIFFPKSIGYPNPNPLLRKYTPKLTYRKKKPKRIK